MLWGPDSGEDPACLPRIRWATTLCSIPLHKSLIANSSPAVAGCTSTKLSIVRAQFCLHVELSKLTVLSPTNSTIVAKQFASSHIEKCKLVSERYGDLSRRTVYPAGNPPLSGDSERRR